MSKLKVLFEKETEIWVDSVNVSLCGNLCKHLNPVNNNYAKCNLFDKDLYSSYNEKPFVGYKRTENCFKLKKL